MALQKAGEVFGFSTDIYIKISKIIIKEVGSDEVGKLYNVWLTADFYTSPTKLYSYQQKEYVFTDIRVAGATFADAYTLIKTNEEFAGFLDA